MFFKNPVVLVLLTVSLAMAGTITAEPRPKMSLPNHPPCFVAVTGTGSQVEFINPVMVGRISTDANEVRFIGTSGSLIASLYSRDPKATVEQFFQEIKLRCQ